MNLPNPYADSALVGGKGSSKAKELLGEIYDGTLIASNKKRRKRSKGSTKTMKSKSSKTKSKSSKSKRKRRRTKTKKTKTKKPTKRKTRRRRRKSSSGISNATAVPGLFSRVINRVRTQVFRKKRI